MADREKFDIPVKYLVLAFALAAVWIWHKPSKLPESAEQGLELSRAERDVASAMSSGATAVDPCLNRPKCFYLYVAPWCPHCHEFLPHVAEIRENWRAPNRPGLKIVIGWDKPAAIREMATQIGAPTFVDDGEGFRKSLNIDSVPYFVVVDKNRQVIARGDDAFHRLNDEMRDQPVAR